MENQTTQPAGKLRHFIIANKTTILIVAAVVLVTAVVVISSLKSNPPAEEQTAGTVATEATANMTEATLPTEETAPKDPILYPEDGLIYQDEDIGAQYLQTDIYSTLDNNVFMDALIYTGYNITKHRADGMMWDYVPAEDKRGLGYLSNISYGGGCSGYETDENGKPNIARFEEGDLVCASFVTYVYFNYLPNVAGIDTSALTRPTSSVSAHSWYVAAMDWVEKGYSEYIEFDYTVLGGLGSSFIKFTPEKEIPIGSIVIFCNPKTSMTSGSHVTVYAGKANGYDWLYHVGNANGPEFCAVQRMNFGPNARWPLAVITPPNIINFTPTLEIELTDQTGKPVAGSEFLLKHPTSGKEISLGVTDESGKLVAEGLSYGDFELVQIVPEGYSCQVTTHQIKLSGVNNSKNKIHIVNTKSIA